MRHHHSHTDIRFFHEQFQKNYSATLNNAEYKYLQVSFNPFSIKVTPEFALAVLLLPREYDKQRYRKFIDDFGTHYMDTAWMAIYITKFT